MEQQAELEMFDQASNFLVRERNKILRQSGGRAIGNKFRARLQELYARSQQLQREYQIWMARHFA